MIYSKVDSKPTLKSLNPIYLDTFSKEELLDYFINTWELYELLFSSVKDESLFYQKPDPLRNPLIFYYGHTAAFYINKLRKAGLINKGICENYEHIFAVGVDPDLSDKMENTSLWPSLNEVNDYRKKIYRLICELIQSMEAGSINCKSPYWALLMGLEHDRIHLETSSVLIRQAPSDSLEKPEGWMYAPMNVQGTDDQWVIVEKGTVKLGQQMPGKIFGWDNEYGSEEQFVETFKVRKNLITNEEYMEFFQEGYANREFWSDEGWNWKLKTKTLHPKFWVKKGNDWRYRAMFDELEMPWDWPVEVNYYEAKAYCRWIGEGSRLLTESEFNLASRMNDRIDPLLSAPLNINFQYGSPTPVGFCEDKKININDLYGNVWDWLEDKFYPLTGFKTHDYYVDFSEPFFDNKHWMLLGGSWATTGSGTSKYYRLWFRPFFYQHAGFRLARDI